MTKEIYARRSIRKFKPDDISREVIDQILDAGRVAPSAKNKQPWKFVVYKNQPKEELLNAMERGIEKQEKNPFMPKRHKQGMVSARNTLRIMREAPVIVMVLNVNSGDPYKSVRFGKRVHEILDTQSIGGAIENMLLTAQDLGIGSLWIGNTVYAHKELAEYMQIDCQITAAVAFGISNETPAGRPKKKLEEIVEYFE